MSDRTETLAREAALADLRKIEEFLRDWDPIGVIDDLIADNHLPNEYDRYAPGLYALLRQGCDADGLAAHLGRIQAESMGLVPSAERDQAIAERIIGWWAKREIRS